MRESGKLEGGRVCESVSPTYFTVRLLSYSYTLSQFYLDVLGRNGAWVDDVFKVKGSRVALGP